jgi:hypothetical protein
LRGTPGTREFSNFLFGYNVVYRPENRVIISDVLGRILYRITGFHPLQTDFQYIFAEESQPITNIRTQFGKFAVLGSHLFI